MSALEVRPLLQAIRGQYRLSWNGTHGIGHWARVYTNGVAIAGGTGADREVLLLFALFHDACRSNDGIDDGHGGRGAELALRYRHSYFDLDDERFSLLYKACSGHTDSRWHPDVTVAACWDADRLDLGRVGIPTNPRRLSSDTARGLVEWASERARHRIVPGFVDGEWATVAPPSPLP